MPCSPELKFLPELTSVHGYRNHEAYSAMKCTMPSTGRFRDIFEDMKGHAFYFDFYLCALLEKNDIASGSLKRERDGV